jgi:site-specific DNA recombinase
MTRRALIYTRMSRDREGAGLGVERQHEDCAELAVRLGWQIVGHHSDNDLSAYSGKPRPGYKALLADLDAGHADAVVAWHTDRLHRRPTELEDYISTCERHNVTTHTVKAGPLDLSTPSGRMIARQLGVVARYEVEHAIERAQRAKLQAATAGKWKGGRRPFGYEADGMTVREPEATEVRRATEALLAGMSLHAIARDWNDRGVTTSTGARWKASSVRALLVRPRSAGLMEHRGEVLGPAQWPALVAEETWRAAVAMVSDPSRKTTTGNARRWLGGHLYLCGVCGGGLRATTANDYPAYRCEDSLEDRSRHVVRRCSELDAYVRAVLIERLSQPDAADLARPQPSVNISAVQVERLAVQARLDELVDLHGTGDITGQQLQRGTVTLRAKLEALDEQLGAAASMSALDGVTGPGAAEMWPTLPLSRQRAILDTLMTVTVHRTRKGRPPGWRAGDSYFNPDGIEITWKAS